MKYSVYLMIIFSLLGCAHRDGIKTSSIDTASKKGDYALLADTSREVLKLIKKRDYNTLAGYVHPVSGVRFTPYSFVDKAKDRVLKSPDIPAITQSKRKLLWGEYDGSGEPIRMTAGEYFNRFVYDADFLEKGKVTVNRITQSGNTENNAEKVYPGCEFVEFMIPMINPEYEGADWRSLHLVFKKENGRYYLVGIIHNEFTI